jgi:hypothetical protein
MGFVDGVLIFSVVGEQKEHERLQKILGKSLETQNCILNIEQ